MRPEDAPHWVYDKMRSEVIEYLAPAIADTAKMFEISSVILSGRGAVGYNSGFDFIGALKERMTRYDPSSASHELVVVEYSETAGLTGLALATLDNNVLPHP
jgi:predicted NBD/HSP70 family sugar kinase